METGLDLQSGLDLLSEPDEAALTTTARRKEIAAALGNFSVQYNFQSIAIALKMAAHCGSTTPQETWVKSNASSAAFAGCIAGQLTMGYVGDVIGRSRALSMTLSFAALSTLLSAVASFGRTAGEIYTVIIVARFFIGFGLGGVYPLSATSAAEATTTATGDEHEEKKASIVRASRAFFWQGPGAMAPYAVALLLRGALKGELECLQWRILLGVGAIPAAAVVIMTAAEKGAGQATQEMDGALLGDAPAPSNSSRTNAALARELRNPAFWRRVVATAVPWCLYDVSFYGLTLMGPSIVASVFGGAESIEYQSAQQLIALSCTLPAVLLSIYLVTRDWSVKRLQLSGFYLAAASLVAFALLRRQTTTHQKPFALFALYCLVNFSLQFGPAVTTFVLPSQAFDNELRSTMNGVASAAGKLGAVLGTEAFPSISRNYGIDSVLIVSAVVSVLGALVTHCFVDDDISSPPKHEHHGVRLFDSDDEDVDDEDQPEHPQSRQSLSPEDD